ncbi:unnamed protein product [Vitrella brassicaformis CCMP3155]|uniref:Uncharacterized protein n=3 Tax=Vitrella brassicaformis TaxID=1169539 RepID=A0A0G4E8L6_VITBC|nr:unnamed protein product [Vitrella brassicaformis CCMP3155]|eukprot:CEL92160.1 unnamed protein product [Vitrella brassicaformis CCMP3155]
MRVLVVDAYGLGAEGRSAFKDFLSILHTAFEEPYAKSLTTLSFCLRGRSELLPLLNDPATEFTSHAAQRAFDAFDVVCIAGEANVLPWAPVMHQVGALLRMCLRCDKPTLCVGSALQSLVFIASIGADRIRVFNNRGRGGRIGDLKRIAADKTLLSTLDDQDCFLDFATGDVYRRHLAAKETDTIPPFSPEMAATSRSSAAQMVPSEWYPCRNVGLHYPPAAEEFQSYGHTLRRRSTYRARVRPAVLEGAGGDFEGVTPSEVRSTEVLVNINKRAMSHWSLKGLPVSFVAPCRHTWEVHHTVQPPIEVLGSSKKGPQIIQLGPAFAMHFRTTRRYPETVTIVSSWVKGVVMRTQSGESVAFRASPRLSIPGPLTARPQADKAATAAKVAAAAAGGTEESPLASALASGTALVTPRPGHLTVRTDTVKPVGHPSRQMRAEGGMRDGEGHKTTRTVSKYASKDFVPRVAGLKHRKSRVFRPPPPPSSQPAPHAPPSEQPPTTISTKPPLPFLPPLPLSTMSIPQPPVPVSRPMVIRAQDESDSESERGVAASSSFGGSPRTDDRLAAQPQRTQSMNVMSDTDGERMRLLSFEEAGGGLEGVERLSGDVSERGYYPTITKERARQMLHPEEKWEASPESKAPTVRLTTRRAAEGPVSAGRDVSGMAKGATQSASQRPYTSWLKRQNTLIEKIEKTSIPRGFTRLLPQSTAGDAVSPDQALVGQTMKYAIKRKNQRRGARDKSPSGSPRQRHSSSSSASFYYMVSNFVHQTPSPPPLIHQFRPRDEPQHWIGGPWRHTAYNRGIFNKWDQLPNDTDPPATNYTTLFSAR